MFSATTLVIIGILAILVIAIVWFISTQNRLVSADEICGNGLSQIGIQQNSRWDALSALAQLTKSYAEYEYEALEKIIALRKTVSGKSSIGEVEQQEDLLNKSQMNINAIAEAYPELKANASYIKTMESVNKYEDNVRMSRMVYNDSVTIYNRLIRQFPTSIASSVLHFGLREYLSTEKQKTEMPEMRI